LALQAIAGLGCTDKVGDDDTGEELVCPSLNNTTCSDAGLPDDDFAAFCDACGELWVCFVHEDFARLAWVGIPCSCINDEGYVEFVKDTECDPTGMTAD
jgi:hypothetical protein